VIANQKTGLIPNSEIFDQINTIQKMAQKRSLVGAVLIATGASKFFTQDLEDR
jgi:hydroxymethylpyrimidine/phosphomethylpyrimidine kinase